MQLDGTAAKNATIGLSASARSKSSGEEIEDGRVLVAGGAQAGTPTANAKIYDPVADSWSRAASMADARQSHAAVGLLDGRVLVTGGIGSAGARSGAEIYDPATNTWLATGGLAHDRFRHTATLLTDGRVLVAGGGSVQSGIYDPARLDCDPIAKRPDSERFVACVRRGGNQMTWKCAMARVTAILAVGWLLAASPAASTTEDIGPWIATMEVYFVPASALVVGADFEAAQSLHLTITDPEGNTMTMSFASDAEGEVSEYVPVDVPGLHTAEIRDDAGTLLSTTLIFAAAF